MMDFRHEVKHEINLSDMLVLRHRLDAVAQPDPHAINGRSGSSMPEGFDPSQMPETSDNGVSAPKSGQSGTTERPSSSSSSPSGRSSFNPSSFSGFSGSQGENTTEFILLGVSAGILILGLLIAALFKRRKYT